jgi:hypothetical protein
MYKSFSSCNFLQSLLSPSQIQIIFANDIQFHVNSEEYDKILLSEMNLKIS